MADYKIVVQIDSQQAQLFDGEKLLNTYLISSAANGIGFEPDSYKTPIGLFSVGLKIGEGAPLGAVFRHRAPTGQIWSTDPANPLSTAQEDLILTRILWLEGREPQNANTRERHIYFHGTNQEALLGHPVSHGCIRFRNRDIEEIFSLVPSGTPVEILP